MQKICPFPGLRTFSEIEALYFKGREHHISKALDLLQKNKFLMLTGSSGDGKSSMVFAGIIPQARGGMFSGGFPNWKVVDFKPQRNPLLSMAEALHDKLNLNDSVKSIEENLKLGFAALIDVYKNSEFYIDKKVLNDPEISESDRKKLKRKCHNLLLVVDQFEELFTNPENFDGNVPSNSSKTLINLIQETNRIAKEQDLPVYIVCTMRSDFFGDCSSFSSFPELIASSHYFIPRLTREEVRKTIEEPVALSGNKITPRLVERLLYELKEGADMLPVLQHALFRVWKEYNADCSDAMDLIHFAKVGGMTPADLPANDQLIFTKWLNNQQSYKLKVLEKPSLANVLNAHANELFESAFIIYDLHHPKDNIDETVAKKIIKHAFLGMTRIDEGRAVRNRISVAQLAEFIDEKISLRIIHNLIAIFSIPENSLIRTYTESINAEEKIGTTVLDITHESLIRNWNSLQQWISEEQQNAEAFYDFEHFVFKWVKNNRSSAHLLSEGSYSFYNDWYKKTLPNEGWIKKYSKVISSKYQPGELMADIISFLKASSNAINLKKKITKSALVVISVLLVISSYAFFKSSIQEAMALKQGKISRSNELAMRAFLTYEKDPTISLRIAQAAFQNEHTPLAAQSLMNAYINGPFFSKLLIGHVDVVNYSDFSHSGNFIISASNDKKAIIWNKNGEKHHVLSGHENTVTSGSFSPDEKRVLTLSTDNSVIIWSIEGQLIKRLQHKAKINVASFIDDGKKIITCSEDSTVKLWDNSGTLLFSTIKQKSAVSFCDYNPANKLFLTVVNNVCSIWDLNGKQLNTIADSKINMSQAKWIDKNKIISYGKGNKIGLWINNKLSKILTLPCSTILHLEVGKKKKFVVARSEQSEAYIIDLSNLNIITLKGHTARINYININNAEDRVVTVSDDNTIRIWSMNGSLISVLKPDDVVYSASFSTDDKFLLTSLNGFTSKIWEIEKNKYNNLFGHHDLIWEIEQSPSGKLMASASWDNSVKIWDYLSGECLKIIDLKEKMYFISFSPDENYLICCGESGTVVLFDIKQDKLIPLKVPLDKIKKAHFIPNSNVILIPSNDGTIYLWDTKGNLLKVLSKHKAGIQSVAVSKEGWFVSGSNDNNAIIWDKKGNMHATLAKHKDQIYRVAISGNDKFIATGSNDNTIMLWNKEGKLLKTIIASSTISDLSFPHNSESFLAFGCTNGDVGVWNFASGKTDYLNIHPHSGMVNVVRFSEDDKYILTCSDDETAKLLDINGKEITVYKGHKGPVQTAIFSKDGKYIMTGAMER